MSTSAAAEEHLRVIRSLMEKATVYRAISAPTALVGGCAGVAAAAAFYFRSPNLADNLQAANRLFLTCWLSALAISAVANGYFLRADAQRRGEKFISAGMRAALRALCPSYLVAAAVTFATWRAPGFLPCQWMLLYGLGLLGTQYFAPNSIIILGWSFVLAGLTLLGLLQWGSSSWWYENILRGNLAMGATFGGFHLIYAVCVWASQRRAPETATSTSSDV